MGLTEGNEKGWLRLMLNEEDMCKSMGLPVNLSDEDKDILVERLLNSPEFMNFVDMEGEESLLSILGETEYIHPDDTKREDESASDWLIRSAISEMDLEDDLSIPSNVGPEIQGYNLILDKFYLMTFPNGRVATVKLNRVMENSLGNDYIFENHGGAEELAEKSNSRFVNLNEFPIPQQFLNKTKFNILN